MTWPVLVADIFGSVGMLLWASIAGVPLLLHLWSKHQHQETPWAAMEFLLAAVEQQARRIRLEQLLLLLLRMAIPVVLGLALAEPMWEWLPSLGSSLGRNTPRHHVLVFDTSYSMGYDVDGESRLDESRRAAQRILDGSQQGDGFTLVTMAGPPQVVIGSPVFANDDVLAEIAKLRVSDSEAELAASLDLIIQTVSAVQASHPRLQQPRVYFFTDLGENTWQATANSRVRDRCGELSSQAELVLVDAGVEAAKNTMLSEVVRLNSTATLAEPVTWRVTKEDVRGVSPEGRAVTLLVDGQPVQQQEFDPEVGQQASTVFRYQFDTEGQHQVEFRLDDDALPVDNRRFQVVTLRDAVRILCIEGKPGAARNVALALSPGVEASPIQTRVAPQHRMADFDWMEFDCVFLCNLSRFAAEDTARLRDYLQQGRSVVIFLGDEVIPENYNEQLSHRGDVPLLPTVVGALAPPGSYLLDPRDYRHPIIQPFRGQTRAGLLTTPVWRYYRLQVPEDSAAEVVLAFTNGDPAIIEQRVGRGRIILVATAASERSRSRIDGRLTPWNAWAAWPSFPPIVQEMLAACLIARDDNHNLSVGDPMGGTLAPETRSRFVNISVQQQGMTRASRAPVIDVEGVASWRFEDTFHAGFYDVELPEDDLPSTKFAVNLPVSDESRLDRFPPEDLPDQFQQNLTIDTNSDRDPGIAVTPLFRALLGLLLLLLLTENYVAWFLGNART